MRSPPGLRAWRSKLRGADLAVQTLKAGGTRRIFTLSGNQIMSVFDACIEGEIELIHVRHEAAAVHMADAWGRLTGEPGVALVTAGPGFANTLSALYVALMAESPLVLLSGHAPLSMAGQGAFQEMAQAEMAAPVTKASWTARDGARLGEDVARAMAQAWSGRPGPVHVALPVDLLETSLPGGQAPRRQDDGAREASAVGDAEARRIVDALAEARRPLVLAGPAAGRGAGAGHMRRLAEAIHTPVVHMESPRGVNDPSLGAFAEVLPESDLLLLLGKKMDFSLGLGRPPAVGKECRILQVDPEAVALDQSRRGATDGPRIELAVLGDPQATARRIADLAGDREWPDRDWYDEVREAVAYRPPAWEELQSPGDGPLHAVEVGRAVQEVLGADSVLISDGGEFGQWAQACARAPHRLINGPSGAIGSAIPFALAARLAFPDSPVVAMLGDGTFGFHPLEFDTAVRYGLPIVAVVGNDATWNAEYQIQLRQYGEERLVGCELLPTRYDEVVRALGGHGEHVSRASELRPALQRALASGLPACVNVDLQRNPAPAIRRGG